MARDMYVKKTGRVPKRESTISEDPTYKADLELARGEIAAAIGEYQKAMGDFRAVLPWRQTIERRSPVLEANANESLLETTKHPISKLGSVLGDIAVGAPLFGKTKGTSSLDEGQQLYNWWNASKYKNTPRRGVPATLGIQGARYGLSQILGDQEQQPR